MELKKSFQCSALVLGLMLQASFSYAMEETPAAEAAVVGTQSVVLDNNKVLVLEVSSQSDGAAALARAQELGGRLPQDAAEWTALEASFDAVNVEQLSEAAKAILEQLKLVKNLYLGDGSTAFAAEGAEPALTVILKEVVAEQEPVVLAQETENVQQAVVVSQQECVESFCAGLMKYLVVDNGSTLQSFHLMTSHPSGAHVQVVFPKPVVNAVDSE